MPKLVDTGLDLTIFYEPTERSLKVAHINQHLKKSETGLILTIFLEPRERSLKVANINQSFQKSETGLNIVTLTISHNLLN